MSVIISDVNNASYDGNLSTANGFYRCEDWNMGLFSTSRLVLNSTRTINVDFDNAGNCQGLVVGLATSDSTVDRSVVVELYEGVTLRATQTLTADQITNSVANKISLGWIIPFVFSTPYAVTTTDATWSFKVYQTGGSTGYWYLSTSDATNPFFVTWCDTQISFNNNDTVIAGTGK